MTFLDHLSLLSLLDWAAAVSLIVMWLAVGWLIEHPPQNRPSVTKLMGENRHEWMRVFVGREPRIFDSQILNGLRQGTAFFASTCVFAIGGVLALIANTDPLRGVAAEVTAQDVPAVIWQIKLALVMLLLASGFLRFVWANRVFGYCSVMMGSVPNDPADPQAMPRAMQAAALNVRAAVNFNRGLRSMYFAMGALAWLLGPVPLLVATVAVGVIVWSREFASIPRDILLGKRT
ncbi:DUF599 domain-containing protein [Yoonia sp. 208BN28-4]|uniref:DUF599 domain-containing protein n=1 Tax=Yoonia sp. 208BN28-4 TaxID=3126505 RepID=UPI0030A4DCEE